MLNEKLLSAIWQYKIFKRYPLSTINGKLVEIIHPGEKNNNAGPDFLNARIKIDTILWAGNIEIHQKTSDFLKHQHHLDKNYHSLILHLVYEHDSPISLPFPIEVIELKHFISESTIQQYQSLTQDKKAPTCINLWDSLENIYIQNWLNRLAIERLEKKYLQIKQFFDTTKDYQETFYRLFCRHLGFKVNNDTFEKLSEKIPLKILLKHSDRLSIVEALIYGTAGFLNKAFKDSYLLHLQNEFEFLKKKYSIHPIDVHLWKFATMRPQNFPSLRLHQLALFIHYFPQMFHDPANFFLNKEQLEKLHIQPEGYFKNHLTFDEDKFVNKTYHFGETSLQLLLINVIVPYLFFYGKSTADEKYQDLALHYLEHIPAENNHIIKKFYPPAKQFNTALHSQALLELYPNYCENRRCTECNIGIKIISQASKDF
jgi:hypothetical protein